MEYNLTDKQRSAITWMVEANRRGELADEFSVMGFHGTAGLSLMDINTGTVVEADPDVTYSVLDSLHSEGLIHQNIKYKTQTRRSGSKNNPRISETQSEQSRRCSLTRRAYEAVDSNFVLPDPRPTAANFHFHGNVSQSIVGTQNRAELTNNMDFGSVREQIDREGGEDQDELHQALDEVERLVESGERLDRGELSEFSELMERHSWFTSAVMSALLGFATQIIS